MAMPTPHRRAFSQIQNTISSSTKASFSKNSINIREEAAAGPVRGTEKENGDKATLALKSKESPIEKESPTDEAPNTEEVFKPPMRYDVPGENFDYLDNFDFDAEIETAPPIEKAPSIFQVDDDFLPPEERISSLGPHFWNRFLMPSVEFDNKENIFEELYANLNLSDSCDLNEIENGLASLELQKMPMHE